VGYQGLWKITELPEFSADRKEKDEQGIK